MSTWTPELKEKVKEMYLEGNPTPENSTELCKQIADEIDQSPNGVRLVLSQLGVYVKKDATSSAGKTTAKKEGEGTKRVSKDSQIEELKAVITARGAEIDDDILGKLTGKAAAYFVKVLSA